MTALGLDVGFEWVSTSDPQLSDLSDFDALWFAPGSPYHDLARTLAAVRYARENRIPCLGTCGGFQHIVIEYARHVLGIAEAQHAEYDPYASLLIVSQLVCSLAGQKLPISLVPGSKVAEVYGTTSVVERYYCNFGINPEYVDALDNAGLSVVGMDQDWECRVMEIREHPFFIGTLYVPQARSTPEQPHPLINAFLSAAAQARGQRN